MRAMRLEAVDQWGGLDFARQRRSISTASLTPSLLPLDHPNSIQQSLVRPTSFSPCPIFAPLETEIARQECSRRRRNNTAQRNPEFLSSCLTPPPCAAAPSD